MTFDLEKETRDLADQVMVQWQGYERSNSVIDLDEERAHSHQVAAHLKELLQAECPESIISVRVDGHKRIMLIKEPR